MAGLLGYGIVRALGEKGAVFLVGEKDLARARDFYGRWGFATIALGRAIGGPAEYLVVVAGLTQIPFRTVFLGIITGAYCGGFSMSFLGAYALVQPELAVVLAVALIVLLSGGFHLFHKYRKNEEYS